FLASFPRRPAETQDPPAKDDRIPYQPQSYRVRIAGVSGRCQGPQPADATPARTRTQRPCGPESRCAAASSSAPVTTAHAQASRTNGAAIAIAGQARTA